MPENDESSHKNQGRKTGALGRAERLAAELRENLKKRKQQARARERAREPRSGGPAGDGEES